MADKKYIGKIIALPKDTADALVTVRDALTKELGFEPSLSQTVARLIAYWNERGGC